MTTQDDDRFAGLPSGIRLCYRVEGPEDGEPLLLIAGLGIDLTSWPQRMVDGFVERGFRVVRFDNREVPRTTGSRDGPPEPPNVRLRSRLLGRPTATLSRRCRSDHDSSRERTASPGRRPDGGRAADW